MPLIKPVRQLVDALGVWSEYRTLIDKLQQANGDIKPGLFRVFFVDKLQKLGYNKRVNFDNIIEDNRKLVKWLKKRK